MHDTIVLQGRQIGALELQAIRDLLTSHPSWHRTRLSRELCGQWGWHNEAGRLKDMACRTLLLKLEARGLLQLPPRRGMSVNGRRNLQPTAVPTDESPLHAALAALTPLTVQAVAPGSVDASLFASLLAHHHYLGHRNCVGENLRYLVREREGRPVACLLFGSAAWQCRVRDAFVGWTPQERRLRLAWTTNNTRFLILPWVRVPHLASHVLGLVARRLSRDWQGRYGHPIHLLETFVERERFTGTCYRAAGWTSVGDTAGRGRNAPRGALPIPPKAVLLKVLDAFPSMTTSTTPSANTEYSRGSQASTAHCSSPWTALGIIAPRKCTVRAAPRSNTKAARSPATTAL